MSASTCISVGEQIWECFNQPANFSGKYVLFTVRRAKIQCYSVSFPCLSLAIEMHPEFGKTCTTSPELPTFSITFAVVFPMGYLHQLNLVLVFSILISCTGLNVPSDVHSVKLECRHEISVKCPFDWNHSSFRSRCLAFRLLVQQPSWNKYVLFSFVW